MPTGEQEVMRKGTITLSASLCMFSIHLKNIMHSSMYLAEACNHLDFLCTFNIASLTMGGLWTMTCNTLINAELVTPQQHGYYNLRELSKRIQFCCCSLKLYSRFMTIHS